MKDSWSIFDTFPNESEAAIYKDALEAAGIPCVLEGGIMASVFALPTARFSQVRLLVPTELLEEARHQVKR